MVKIQIESRYFQIATAKLAIAVGRYYGVVGAIEPANKRVGSGYSIER
jgi:hypothetical protein